MGSFFIGVLTLAALEVVTSSPGAANRTAAIPTFAAALANRLIDPNLGLLPNFADTTAALAHQDAIRAAQAAAAPPTMPGGTVITGAGVKVRTAATSPGGGLAGPGI